MREEGRGMREAGNPLVAIEMSEPELAKKSLARVLYLRVLLVVK